MKFTLNLFIAMSCISVCMSQTSAHVDVIEDAPITNTSPMLTYSVNAPTFNLLPYSRELKPQRKTFSMMYADELKTRTDWPTISFEYLKFSDDYIIEYRRNELQRMLPQPPDIWDFCPSSAQ